MAAGLDFVRRLDLSGHFIVHSVHPEPVRHLHRPLPGHLPTDILLQDEEVQETGKQNNWRGLGTLSSHHVPAYLGMVCISVS